MGGITARCWCVSRVGREAEEMTQRTTSWFNAGERTCRPRFELQHKHRIVSPGPASGAVLGPGWPCPACSKGAGGGVRPRRSFPRLLRAGGAAGRAGRPPAPRRAPSARRARRPRPLMQSQPRGPSSSSSSSTGGPSSSSPGRPRSRRRVRPRSSAPSRREPGRNITIAPARQHDQGKRSGFPAQSRPCILPAVRSGGGDSPWQSGRSPICVKGVFVPRFIVLWEGGFCPRRIWCLRFSGRLCVVLHLSLLFHCRRRVWKRSNSVGKK